jgi:hypothetical protein
MICGESLLSPLIVAALRVCPSSATSFALIDLAVLSHLAFGFFSFPEFFAFDLRLPRSLRFLGTMVGFESKESTFDEYPAQPDLATLPVDTSTRRRIFLGVSVEEALSSIGKF